MIAFQLFSIALMIFQSFFAAYYLGIAMFGAQMLVLAPVFLGQAVFEPYVQALANSNPKTSKVALNPQSFSLVLSGVFLSVFVLGYALSGTSYLLLISTLLVYLIYTSLMAYAFAQSMHATASTAVVILFLAFVISFLTSDLLLGSNQLVLANLLAFFLSSAYLIFKIFPVIEIEIVNYSNLGSRWYEGVLFRLPVVFFTSVSIILLGLLGVPPTVIGEYRVFLSGISSARYFNLIPLPKLQLALSNSSGMKFRFGFTTMQLYLASLLVFQLTLIVLFPFFYDTFIGTSSFSRFELGLGVSFVLLQPLAYKVFWRHRGNYVLNTVVPVAITSFVLGLFTTFILLSLSPFLSVGLVSMSAVVVYVATIALIKGPSS